MVKNSISIVQNGLQRYSFFLKHNIYRHLFDTISNDFANFPILCIYRILNTIIKNYIKHDKLLNINPLYFILFFNGFFAAFDRFKFFNSMKNTRMAFFSFGLPFLLYTLFPFGGTTASAQPADRPRYLDSTDFAADPAAHVFDDKIHVYCTHDWDSPVTDRTDGNPLKADDPHRFFEAAWLHKHNGTYYFTYSTGSTHLICHATGDSPYGPFTYRGVVLTPVVGWTTHQSVCEYNGKWHFSSTIAFPRAAYPPCGRPNIANSSTNPTARSAP